jgi:hypothetical protein
MLALLVVAPTALGADGPPGEKFAALLGLRLENATLADVERRLGRSVLRESGDAGEYEASICYDVPASRTAVTFRSGELGGSDHVVLEFELRKYETRPECLMLDSSVVPASSLRVAGLYLGMTEESFSRVLGGSEPLPGGGVGRVFERREPMTAEERARNPATAPYPFWDVVIWVRGEFRGGKLSRLVVSKTVTS